MDNLVSLIEAVKKCPKLFTNSSQNDELRDWTAVAQECQMTITEAQDQWNFLLMEYVEYLKNNQDFSLAQQMDFLQPYFFTMNNSENFDEDELLKAIDYKSCEKNLCYLKSTKTENKTLKEDVEKNIITEQNNSIKTQSRNINYSTEIRTTLESSTTTSQDFSFTNLTSLELIFLGYAKQLQRMPLHIQLKTKRKIADIMDETELQTIT